MDKWSTFVLPCNIVVDSEEINRTQGETIMVASIYDMSEMTTIRPRPDSIYILLQMRP